MMNLLSLYIMPVVSSWNNAYSCCFTLKMSGQTEGNFYGAAVPAKNIISITIGSEKKNNFRVFGSEFYCSNGMRSSRHSELLDEEFQAAHLQLISKITAPLCSAVVWKTTSAMCSMKSDHCCFIFDWLLCQKKHDFVCCKQINECQCCNFWSIKGATRSIRACRS